MVTITVSLVKQLAEVDAVTTKEQSTGAPVKLVTVTVGFAIESLFNPAVGVQE